MRDIRQHVNPLAQAYQTERAERIEVPRLTHGAHLEVELGCADAKFSFDHATSHPQDFVVGLEIREAVVERNELRRARLGLENLRFAYVNLNVDLEQVFDDGQVDRFHLLFPDPWFKARHKKRRVVNTEFLRVVARQLRVGGEFHMATDVWELAIEAMAVCESDEVRDLGFTNLAEDGPWSFAQTPPVEARSRREDTTRARGGRVWRLRYGWQT